VTSIDKSWLGELPPFLSIHRIATLFDQPEMTVRRWVRDPDHMLRGEKLENGRYVVPREHVVAYANKLYGRLEAQSGGNRPSAVHHPTERDSGDGVDRSGDLWPAG
jgi:hypothetical protein